jgi:DNA repair exonuclease SbcCD nuclease subunit
MKFLHTADWHIGLKASNLGGAGARVRNERLRTARKVIGIANERGVDFVVLAGDTFDDHGVKPDVVREVVSILSESSAPVYLIPGTRDYVGGGSGWEKGDWGRAGNIHVLVDEAPVDAGESTALFPCPVREKKSVVDPTAWIPPERLPGKIKIAVAHGSVEGLPKEESDLPIPRNLPKIKNLDYAAIGHWHSYSAYADAENICRMGYSGAFEPTKFGKPDSGCAAIVTIERPGAAPAVERLDTGGLTWIDRREQVDGGGGIAAVIESILSIDDKESTLIKVALSGVYGLSDVSALRDLRAIGDSGRFLYFEASMDDLRLISGDIHADTGWIGGIDEALVRVAGERIAGMLPDAGESKAVFDRALLELYMMSADAKR